MVGSLKDSSMFQNIVIRQLKIRTTLDGPFGLMSYLQGSSSYNRLVSVRTLFFSTKKDMLLFNYFSIPYDELFFVLFLISVVQQKIFGALQFQFLHLDYLPFHLVLW